MSDKKTTKQIDNLLGELDRIARDYNAYDFGLPLFNDEQKTNDQLREAVRKWLKENE